MGFVSSGFVVAVVVLLSSSLLCNGGITSSFVRKVEKTIDMPFHSDVFSIPPGYNAPQQVFLSFSILVFFIVFLNQHIKMCFCFEFVVDILLC